jgi:hypothetical protein
MVNNSPDSTLFWDVKPNITIDSGHIPEDKNLDKIGL